MLVQSVGRGAGGAVMRRAAPAGVARGVAARAHAEGRRGRAPRPCGHCRLGAAEVPGRAVGEAEVAQDVGRAVTFCTRDTDAEGVRCCLPRGPTCHQPALGRTRTLTTPAADASQQVDHAALTTHLGTAPLCPAAHMCCWSPGGLRAAPSCPQLSRRAAACSGTASLGRGHGGMGRGEGVGA